MNFFIMISKLFYGGIYITVVRMVRIELTLRNRNGILSPARLPIPPHSHMCIIKTSKEVVVRDRIELSTQGFSILCSTDWAIEPLSLLNRSGGERRIRTFEAVGGGFTVRRIWPLSNLTVENVLKLNGWGTRIRT